MRSLKKLAIGAVVAVSALGFAFSSVSVQAMNVLSQTVKTIGVKTTIRMEVEVPRATSQVPVDLVFVIDNSASMSEHQKRLLDNAGDLAKAAVASGADVHAAVITTTADGQSTYPPNGDLEAAELREGLNGKFAGLKKRFAATADGDFEKTLLENLSSAMTINGSATEQPFEAIRKAFSEPLISTVNQGFLRGKSALGFFVLTDGDDQSSMTTENFVQFLKDLKPNGVVTMHAAYIPWVSGAPVCQTAEAKPERLEAVLQHFGTLRTSVSLCGDNFGSQLKSIGTQYGRNGLTVVQLTIPADPATIRVTYGTTTLSGGNLRGGWVYDSNTMKLTLGEGIDWLRENQGTPLVIEFSEKTQTTK